MKVLVLLFLFQIKHWYADFMIQTYAQTVRKGIYGDPVGISHTLDHVVGTVSILLFASFFIKISVPMIIIIGALDCIIHYHIDWFKVYYGTKDTNIALFWQQFGHDQLGHQLTYLLFGLMLIL